MEATTEPNKPWVLPVRITISVALLGVLFWHVRDDFHWSELFPEWSVEALSWLAGSVLLLFVGFFLSTIRWQQVLLALDVRGRIKRLFSHFLAGQFISAFLPGTVGGDVVRMARLTKDTHNGPTSFASVVLERLTGWIVLPLITFLGFLLNPALRHLGARTRIALAIAAGTLVALLLLLYAVDHPKLGGRFAGSHGWRRFAGAVHFGVVQLRHQPSAALSVIGAGFIYQMSLVLAALMTARALGIDNLGFTALMAFFPAVLIAQVLPISIGGLGVREFALVFFLGAVGVGKEQALALGLVFYLLTLVASLSGAPSFAVGKGAEARGRLGVTDGVPSAIDADHEAPVDTGLRWWREVIYVLIFYLIYSWIRNQFGSNSVHPDEAFRHALDVIDIEKAIGLYVEPTIQGWFVTATSSGLDFGFTGARQFMRFWNVFYGTFHFVVTAFALIWTYRRFPASYRKWRNVLAVTTALALVGFSLYPLMPPRLLSACTDFGRCLPDYSYVDSLAAIGGLWSFDSGTMQAVSNQYAAMPSLHFAWSLWSFFTLFPHLRHRWSKILIALYPFATLFAVMVTANHYWLDAAGGALILGIGYLLGTALTNVVEESRLERIERRENRVISPPPPEGGTVNR